MYTRKNFKNVKEIKVALAKGEKLTVYAPGLGTVPENGTTFIEGPHYPAAHTWYAEATMKDGYIVKVK